MTATASVSYDPREFKALIFHDITPRAYLERCLETIATREPEVQAFVVLNEAGAREAADTSTARWKAGRPLTAIDGLAAGGNLPGGSGLREASPTTTTAPKGSIQR